MKLPGDWTRLWSWLFYNAVSLFTLKLVMFLSSEVKAKTSHFFTVIQSKKKLKVSTSKYVCQWAFCWPKGIIRFHFFKINLTGIRARKFSLTLQLLGQMTNVKQCIYKDKPGKVKCTHGITRAGRIPTSMQTKNYIQILQNSILTP